MRTRNQNWNDGERERYDRDYRNVEPFDEFRGYRESEYERSRSYNAYDPGREHHHASRSKHWDSFDPNAGQHSDYHGQRNWERNSYEHGQEGNWDDTDARGSYYERNEPRPYDEDRYESHHRPTYKGRYYGRHETAQDREDIRRRYEESRRNSNWSSGYLPQSGW